MVRTKLDNLKKEIEKYLGIPYFINRVNIPDAPFAGKATYKQIKIVTQLAAKSEGINLSNLSPQDFYRLQKRHNIGIDCSGLAYHLLDFCYQQITGNSIKNLIVGTDDKTGPRRVNALMFSHPNNSHTINNYSHIKTGDLIITNQKKHILFVVEVTKNRISYVHSSQKTETRGVHYGLLTITDPQKDLTYQHFSETLKIHPSDAVYRLHIFD